MTYIYTVANTKNRKDCLYEKCPHCRLHITKGNLTIHIRTQCIWFKPSGTIGIYHIVKVK